MLTKNEEIIIAIITSTSLLLVMIAIIIIAIVKYQRRARKYQHEMSDLKIKYQEETIKAQLEKEEQTLTRISQEIHDNIGQILSLVKLNLNTLSIADCPDSVKEKILTSKDLVGKAIVDLRHLSKSLNSLHLSQGYLSELLNSELEIINKTGVYIVKFDVTGKEKPFHPQKRLIVFRIAQEAMNNIIKHAKASHISVTLNYREELFNLFIEDDGEGFTNTLLDSTILNESGTGIANMQNRAQLIGGLLKINSTIGKGTSVHLSVPID